MWTYLGLTYPFLAYPGLSWPIFRPGHEALLAWTLPQELDPVGCLPPGADRRFDPKDPEQYQVEAKFEVLGHIGGNLGGQRSAKP